MGAAYLPVQSVIYSRALFLTRGKSLEAPLAELRKTNTESSPDKLCEVKQVARERTHSRSDKSSVADEYTRKQRDEIAQAMTVCKGARGRRRGRCGAPENESDDSPHSNEKIWHLCEAVRLNCSPPVFRRTKHRRHFKIT